MLIEDRKMEKEREREIENMKKIASKIWLSWENSILWSESRNILLPLLQRLDTQLNETQTPDNIEVESRKAKKWEQKRGNESEKRNKNKNKQRILYTKKDVWTEFSAHAHTHT